MIMHSQPGTEHITKIVDNQIKVMLGAALGGMGGTISMALALLNFGNANIWMSKSEGTSLDKRIQSLEDIHNPRFASRRFFSSSSSTFVAQTDKKPGAY